MSTAEPKPGALTPERLAGLRKSAESWASTYGARGAAPTAWEWLNGRAHPELVLALLDRIADLETGLERLLRTHVAWANGSGDDGAR